MKLVIELDGGQHYLPENKKKDDERTEFLEARGYHVLRFSNRDLIEHFDGVFEKIFWTVRERRVARAIAEYPMKD